MKPKEKVRFSKYNGCGNDFIMIDNRKSCLPKDNEELIRRLCHRSHGIGADGMILLEDCSHADMLMRIFNSDGTEADMCGNGIRCLVSFAKELGITKERYTIETLKRRLLVSFSEDKINVAMGQPFDLQWHIPIKINGSMHKIHHLNTGVPHVVLFNHENQNSTEMADLDRLGPKLQKHTLFTPKGINVNVATIDAKNGIDNRTFERNVGETLACGTGCTAVALAAATLYGIPSPIIVRSKGGPLEVSFKWKGGVLCDIVLSGTTSYEFSGHTEI